MKSATRPFLIDISRLVGRLIKGRLPTGIDRVALAYVQKYGSRSLAFVRYSCFHAVLPANHSQRLFNLLLNPPSDFKTKAVRLIVTGTFNRVSIRDLQGCIFFNMGHSGLEDYRYGALLQRMKVRPVFMVHDLIPIAHPEFCRPGEREKHQIRMRTVLELACGVITNSQTTLDALTCFSGKSGMVLPPSITAFLAPHSLEDLSGKRPVDRPYFVVLGTIEPRKNHLLLLQVWKRLVELMGNQAPVLVVIGQIGWECENVIDMLERCNVLHGCIIERSACTDAELSNWLHHAQALLFPSFAEGFGLPLLEALAHGTPVIASNLPVFREISGDIPDYLDPLDGLGWMEIMYDYSFQDNPRRNNQLQRMAGFVLPTWERHFRQVDILLEQLGS